MKGQEEIEDKAFNWSVDYKPWALDLPYQRYAEEGYKQGYLRALEDINVGNKFTHIQVQIQENE